MKHLWVLSLALLLPQQPIWAQTLNQANEGTKPLTDKEVHEANNYVHQGRKQQVMQEECAKLSEKYNTPMGCDDKSSKPGQVFKGTTGVVIEEVLPKLYAIMGTAAMAGSGGKILMKPEGTDKTKSTGTNSNTKPDPTPKETGSTTADPGGANKPAGTDTKAADAKTEKGEERSDICIYIPMAGELVASGMQAAQEKNIAEAKPGVDAQKEGLHAVARTHDARAKTATIQGGIYAATAACYVSYIASGAVVDWKLGLKLGAATVMSGIFFKKANNHKKFASDVRAIASKLPGAGDCNPHTQTQCFCSEPTSRNVDIANFQKVCVPQQLASREGKLTSVPCSTLQNGNAVLDMECRCKRNNTCLNGQLASMGAEIGFGGYDLADPLRLLGEMNGTMNEANVSNFGAQLNARSKAALDKESIADVPSMRGLNAKENGLAKEMNKMGLPARMAAFAAQQAGSAPASASAPAIAGIKSDYGSDDSYSGSTNRGTSYNYAGSTGSARRSGPGITPFKSPLDKSGKPSAVQVETYSEEALAAADINKDTSKGIFDIISHRYRSSAWRRFEMDKAVDAAPVANPNVPVVPVPNPAVQ